VGRERAPTTVNRVIEKLPDVPAAYQPPNTLPVEPNRPSPGRARLGLWVGLVVSLVIASLLAVVAVYVEAPERADSEAPASPPAPPTATATVDNAAAVYQAAAGPSRAIIR
jgi:hypothetical protein